ncbi:MAG TPA: hypothetical protein VFD50_04835, partial [Thermoleophilia bacterium]|nr:hypothetical protein [Thermoleophilia bacterium]
MLELFGRRHGAERRFLKIEEISNFVESIAELEKPAGQPSFLWVPLEREEEVVRYRVKVVYDGFERWVDYHEGRYSPTDQD